MMKKMPMKKDNNMAKSVPGPKIEKLKEPQMKIVPSGHSHSTTAIDMSELTASSMTKSMVKKQSSPKKMKAGLRNPKGLGKSMAKASMKY